MTGTPWSETRPATMENIEREINSCDVPDMR